MPAVLKQKPEYRLKVEYDDEPINPRKDYDNFAHMACWLVTIISVMNTILMTRRNC